MATRRNLRLAAGYLESLPTLDRQWLLAQLPAEIARQVESERSTMPKQLRAADVRDLVLELATPSSTSTESHSQEPKIFDSFLEDAAHKRIVDAEVTKLLKILLAMPDRFSASLLGVHEWPWRDVLLTARPRLRRLLGEQPPPVTVATRRAIIRSLASALEIAS